MAELGGRVAYVFVRDDWAGVLSEEENGFRFQYDADYLRKPGATAVSLTLPLREEAYYSATLFPFFDGLLPEGWMLNLAVENWKLDPRDRFGILLAVCHDCIGNVSIRRKKA